MSPSVNGGKGHLDRAAICAVVSTDAAFIESLQSSPPFQSGAFRLELDLRVPYPDILDSDLERLRTVAPDVVILDLESDLPIGLKFAEFLGDSGIGKILLGSASPQAPDVLIDVMHAGISDFIPKPLTGDELGKALRSAERRLGKSDGGAEDRPPGELFVFFGSKGGAGCTTLCTNTGIDVHRASRRRTLLLDLDLELGEAALQLGEEPRFNMVDLVRNFHRVDSDLLASYIGHHSSGVDLLSAPYQPAGFEALSHERVTQILAFLQSQYDYVFVDVPRALNPATIAAIEAADLLILVTPPDVPGVRNVARCMPLLEEFRGERPRDWICLVVNRYDPRGIVSLKQVEEATGLPVFATVRNDYRIVMNAINENIPAVLAGRSDFASDVRELAGKLAHIEIKKRTGWLRGLVQSLHPSGTARAGHRREVEASA
jgi:pilus assembly protein CpaE